MARNALIPTHSIRITSTRGSVALVVSSGIAVALLVATKVGELAVLSKASAASRNRMARTAADMDQNAAEAMSRLLKSKTIVENTSVWQSSVPSNNMWTFSPAGQQPAAVSFNFCRMDKLTSAELNSVYTGKTPPNISGCTQANPTSSLLSRNSPNKVDTLTSVNLIQGSRQVQASIKSRMEASPCADVASTQLIVRLFGAILGRNPSATEIKNYSTCIANGTISLSDLESTDVAICGSSVHGLRGLPEYSEKKEALLTIYYLYLGRFIGASDTTNVNNYLTNTSYLGGVLADNSNFIAKLQATVDKFKSDYGISAPAPTPIDGFIAPNIAGSWIDNNLKTITIEKTGNDLKFIYGGTVGTYTGKFTSATQLNFFASPTSTIVGTIQSSTSIQFSNGVIFTLVQPVPTNRPLYKIAYLQYMYFNIHGLTKTATQGDINTLNLADGLTTLKAVASSERASALYASNGGVNAEKVIGLYYTLIGSFPDAATSTVFTSMLNAGQTDAVLTPLSWLAAEIKSTTTYEAAGGCVGPVPKPQSKITYYTSGSFSWTGYKPACLCGTPPNHTVVACNHAVTTYCSPGVIAAQVQAPDPVTRPKLFKSFVAFGTISSAQWGSYSMTRTPPAVVYDAPPPVEITSFNAGDLLTSSGVVTGPGGTTTSTASFTVPAQKQSWYGYLIAGSVHGQGPPIGPGGNKLQSGAVYTPAPILNKDLWGVYPPTFDPASMKYSLIYGCYADVICFDSTRGRWTNRIGRYSCNNAWGSDLGVYDYLGNSSGNMTYATNPDPYATGPGSKTALLSFIPPEQINYQGYSYKMWNQATLTWGSPDIYMATLIQSPLSIDIGNNGISFTKPGEGAEFDLEGHGKAGSYFWVNESDTAPWIAFDKNGSGTIDGISELFGNNTQGPDGKTASNGFDALAKYDTNRDGFIDSNDAIYAKLSLWFDHGSDGKSSRKELVPLSLAGIKRIDLAYANIAEFGDFYGNMSKQRSLVEMVDGSYRRIYDIWLAGTKSSPSRTLVSQSQIP